MKEPTNPMTTNPPTGPTMPDPPEPSPAIAYAGTNTSRPEAEVAAEERARTVAHGSRPPFTPASPLARWVRVGDLLPQVTAAASGRGINLQTELASRARQGSLNALKSAGRATGALPQHRPFSTLARLGHQATPRAQRRGIQ